jgi:hypothetical protein
MRNNRWGGIFHNLKAADVGADFDLLTIGDKVSITDSYLGLSAAQARVMGLELNLDRSAAYELTVLTMPYTSGFTIYKATVSLADYSKMLNSNRFL